MCICTQVRQIAIVLSPFLFSEKLAWLLAHKVVSSLINKLTGCKQVKGIEVTFKFYPFAILPRVET
jgi:hypothetical protein